MEEMESTQPLKAYDNQEFLNSKEGRTIRILSEYLYPDQYLKKNHIYNTIVLFGSARSFSTKTWQKKIKDIEKNLAKQKDQKKLAMLEKEFSRMKRLEFTCKYYDETVELIKLLTNWTKTLPLNKKFYVCTGGGGGMMEAANFGAYKTGSKNIGFNIQLPFEQHPNPYITPELNFEFHYFFMRKFWFAYYAKAMIAMPGGFGTFDELFEILTLQQTKILSKKVPIVLYGSDFWKKTMNFEFLADIGMINYEDLELFHFSDSPEEAFEFLKIELSELLFINNTSNE